MMIIWKYFNQKLMSFNWLPVVKAITLSRIHYYDYIFYYMYCLRQSRFKALTLLSIILIVQSVKLSTIFHANNTTEDLN